MRLLAQLCPLAFGLLLGYSGWRGAEYLLVQARPQRLLDRAVAAAPAVPESGLTAVILFRPDECPELMGTMDQLGKVDGSTVRIVGALMVEEHRMPGWELLVKAQRIRFPVYRLDPGKARASTASLGYGPGPLLVVFDRDGRVLLATDVLRQQNLVGFLEELTQRFSPKQDNRRARA